MRWNKFILAVSVIALSGCASSMPALDAHSEHFGEAVAQNIAAQRVAPSAEEKANTYIPPNAKRQKAAREAYENGSLAQPQSVSTTDPD